MKTKQILAVSSLVMALGMAQSASATTSFAFDPNGTGLATNTYDLIDQLVGNAIGINATIANANFLANQANPNNPPLSTTFQLAYQANLNSINDTLNGVSPTVSNGVGGNYFNFTLQFQEEFLSIIGGPATPTATFGFVPGGTNIFEMFF